MRAKFRAVLAAAAFVAGSSAGLVTTTTAAQADNPCAVSGTASYYWHGDPSNPFNRARYAQAHMDRNPCRLPFRAYIICDAGGGTVWRFGEEENGSGTYRAWSTTQDCDPFFDGRQKGYQVFVNGQWVTFAR